MTGLVSGLLTVAGAPPATAGGGASLNLTKSVSSAAVVPSIGATLAVDRSVAIPGDALTYTARVTNTGAVLTLKGSYSAAEGTDAAGTLADWYEEVEYHDPVTKVWLPLGGYQATNPGWTPAVPSPATTGLTVQTVPVASSGVTYPNGGDHLLGTVIGAGKTANWSYTAQLTLSAAQVGVLADPKRSDGIRNVVHVEVTPRDPKNGQPYIYRAEFANPFTTAANTPITGVSVAFTLPDGSTRTVGQAAVPALASIPVGGSVDVPVKYTVPVPPAKGSTETDADYRARLGSSDGATLAASADATGSSSAGPVAAPTAHASATEALPIGSVVKTGPATADAGQTASYGIVIGNTGGAPATEIVVGDTTPDGSHADVSTAPANLAPGATASLSAGYAISATQPDGPLTDTAAFTWRDANHNLYGPVLSSFTTTVASPYLGATLTLTPLVAGPDVAGTSQQLTATLVDASGKPIVGKTVAFAVIGANTASGSAVTDAQGKAAFHYSGAQDGTDSVQASLILGGTSLQSNTASVSWVIPTVNVSTTSVKGQFFAGACGYFCHAKSDTPAFTEFFPTINFNPPGGTVPHNISGISTGSRPFTDITTDVNGNFNGAVTAQGNGLQAGVGALFDFEAVFTANYVVAKAGDVTFNFFSDDGFVFGLGGGATRVSGVLVNAPSSTAFQDYPVMGAYNDPTGPRGNQVTVHFPAAGVYPYELDYSECCGGELAMTMTSANGTGIPPAGNLNLTPGSVPTQPTGHPLTMTLAAMDAGGQPVANLPLVLTVTGPNQQQVSGTTDINGLAKLTYTGQLAGQDHLQVGASLSGTPAISNNINVNWAYSVPGSSSGSATAPPPTVSAPTPADGAMITKPTPIKASFTPPAGQSITRWSVSYRAVQATASTVIASGSGTPPATLATFDPTVLANGAYQITISATASGGGVQNATTSVAVTGQLKPGRYVTSYDDLSVPVAGIGMKIKRSYDSYDTSSGDFGPGWHVALSNMTIRANHVLGDGGWSLYPTNCVFGLCNYAYTSTTPHYVTITYSDGHSEVFDFTPAGGAGPFYFLGTSAFTPRPGTGTTSTLQVNGDTSVDYGFNGSLSGDLNGPVYDPQRFDLTTKDGHVYTLDRTLGLVAEKDANANTITVDSTGVHSSNGQSISYTRDPAHGNRITTITGPGGQAITYSYSTAGDLTSVQYPGGVTAGYNYDASHHLTGSAGGGKPSSTMEYDDAGRMVAIVDGAGNRTVLDNEVAGQQQIVHDPNGLLTVVYTYDDLGDVVQKDQIIGGVAQTTKASFDAVGRMVDLIDPQLHHQHWVYDETDTVGNGNLLSYTNANGRTTHFTGYDAHGHASTVTSPDGVPIGALNYDSTTGLLLSSQRPGLPPSVFSYYSNGLKKSSIDPAGRTVNYTYNSVGYQTSISDAAGHTRVYVPDANGRNTSVTDPSHNTTHFTYDGMGNVASVTDPSGVTQTFHYNNAGRLDQASDGSHATTYTYNDAGRVSERTDRNGAVTSYSYDVTGKLTKETRPGNDVISYRYDALGRLVETDNADAEVTFSYDTAGNLASQLSCAPQPAHADCAAATGTSQQPMVQFDYGWAEDGQQASVTGPAGTTRYQYNDNGWLSQVTDPAGHPFSFHFDTQGRPSSVDSPNGVLDSFSYDPSSLLTGREATSGATTVGQSDYTLDPATAQRSSATDLDGTSTFTYQDNGWLSQATHPAGSGVGNEDYTYDGAGNLTSTADVPAGQVAYTAGRLTQFGGTAQTYDAEGNLISKTDTTTGEVTRYHWNTDHELTAVDLPDGSTVSYSYDPLHRRVQSVHAGQTTRYAWDAFNLAAVYDGNNHLVASYVTLPTGAAADDVRSPAEVLERTGAGGAAYFVHDGSESTTALTDAAGAVTSRYRYNSAGLPASDNGPETGYTWNGAQYDATTGLYYLNDRYYDPTAGRFISEDPASAQYYEPPLGRWTHSTSTPAVTDPVSYNRFAYAGNDPVNLRDPSGDAAGAGVMAFACVAGSIFSNGIAYGASDEGRQGVVEDVAACIEKVLQALNHAIDAVEILKLVWAGDYRGAVMKLLEDALLEVSEELFKYAIVTGYELLS
ncbi:MAG: RHS repeat-associated core domain-containing protein [Jatrophihabitantaceae bacterium]